MNYFRRIFSFQIIFGAILALIVIFWVGASVSASTSSNEMQQSGPLCLELNKKEGVKLLYANMLISPSAGGQFWFFKRNLDGGRDKIFKGPLYRKKDVVFKIENNKIVFSQNDSKSGASCQVRYSKKGDNEIVVSLKFIAPKQASSLSFEILTLLADIFSGKQIKADPFTAKDAKRISIEGTPKDKRFLLKNKNKVLLHGNICDFEIIDLLGLNSINLADFRKISWAKDKGLYFYATKNVMVPGKEYEFQYAIRTYEEHQRKISKIEKNNSGFSSRSGTTDLFIDVPPKTEILKNGLLHLEEITAIYGVENRAAEIILQRELSRNGIQVKISAPQEKFNNPGIQIKKITQCEKDFSDLVEDGFELRVQENGIQIFGKNKRGCINGVHALINKFRSINGKLSVPCCLIKDWPSTKYRGICMVSDFIPVLYKNIELYKKYLDAISLSRGNVVIFYHKPTEILKWINGEKDNRYWSFDEMREISDYAKFLGLEVWAGMVGKIEKNKISGINIKTGSNFYNPEEKSSYQFLFSLYDKIIDLYNPSHFLIGHDEIKGMNLYAKQSKKSSSELLSTDIKRLHKWFSKKDIKILMWGDMLLDNKNKAFEPANSNNSFLNSGATHLAINDIPKDIKIIDWHYNERKQYTSISYFRNHGFEVIGASYHSPAAACSLSNSIKKFDGQGILATNWGFWRTFLPSSTTLYALVCGWTGQSLPPDAFKSNKDSKFLAGVLRGKDYTKWETMTPVRLNTICNNSTWDTKPNDGTGLFDIGQYLDLRALPAGNHTIEGISFYLLDAKGGMGNNCITLYGGKDDQSIPSLVLQSKNKIEAIAFLHTLYVKEPNFDLRKIGEYIFEYIDGKEFKVDIIYGWNITDIRSNPGVRSNRWSFYRSPDILVGSKIAWKGNTIANIPINLQMLIAKNPFPEKVIKKVRIKMDSKDRDSIMVLFAMTALN